MIVSKVPRLNRVGQPSKMRGRESQDGTHDEIMRDSDFEEPVPWYQ
jgi:hypothetical protein